MRTSGEFAFCHPEESAASMVIEISDEVCECQRPKPRELNNPSADSEHEKMPAVVSLCLLAIVTIFCTPSARCSGVIAAVCSKCRIGKHSRTRSPAPRDSGTGSKSGSGC